MHLEQPIQSLNDISRDLSWIDATDPGAAQEQIEKVQASVRCLGHEAEVIGLYHVRNTTQEMLAILNKIRCGEIAVTQSILDAVVSISHELKQLFNDYPATLLSNHRQFSRSPKPPTPICESVY